MTLDINALEERLLARKSQLLKRLNKLKVIWSLLVSRTFQNRPPNAKTMKYWKKSAVPVLMNYSR